MHTPQTPVLNVQLREEAGARMQVNGLEDLQDARRWYAEITGSILDRMTRDTGVV